MASEYLEYKSCTNQFVQWIVKAASSVDKSSKKLSNTINALIVRTRIITRDDSSMILAKLSESNPHDQSSLVDSFQSSMSAGYRAIQLRKYLHLINSMVVSSKSNNAEHLLKNETHAHCIQVLESCYTKLRLWWKERCRESLLKPSSSASTATASATAGATASAASAAASETSSATSLNMFAILKSLEDVGITEEVGDSESSDDTSDPSDRVTFEEVDTSTDVNLGDLRITALCLTYDMITLIKEVKKVWQDVRQEKVSILTAVAVTMTAYRQVDQRQSAMQLKYPSMQTAEDFYVSCVIDELSDSELARLNEAHSNFFREQMNILSVLSSMSTAINSTRSKNSLMVYRRGALGQPYDEHSSPLRMGTKDLLEYLRFFADELAVLYNNFYNIRVQVDDKNDDSREGNPGQAPSSSRSYQKINEEMQKEPTRFRFINQPLTYEFYSAFIPHFQKGLISVAEVFLVHCWVQSIDCLQDRETRFLGRSLYMMRKLGRSIDTAVKEYLENPLLDELYDSEGNQRREDKELQFFSFATVEQPYGAVREYSPLHWNPILQGCVTLDKLMNYVSISTQMMQGLSSYHRGVSHLYHALRNESYLSQDIPDLHCFYRNYSPYVFVGGRPDDVTQGQYEKQYMLASHLTALGLSKHAANSTGASIIKTRQRLDATVMSASYRCLYEKDYSSFDANDSTKFSLSKLLQAVANGLESELFTTRYLSFKLTTFHLKCYSLFKKIRESDSSGLFQELYRIAYDDFHKETASFRHTQALELSIMTSCLRMLDMPKEQRDSRFEGMFQSISALLVESFTNTIAAVRKNNQKERKMLEDLDDADSRDLYLGQLDLEELERNELFHLPTTRKWLHENFGIHTWTTSKSMPENKRVEQFCIHMDMLEELESSLQPLFQVHPQGRPEDLMLVVRMKLRLMKKRLLDKGKLCPGMFGQVELGASQMKITILDHVMAGIWKESRDTDLFEWVLEMWGFNFNPDMANTPMHIAVINRQPWALDFLLRDEQGGRNMNFQSPVLYGNTALHFAAMVASEESMRKLLMHFCDPSIRNNDGKLYWELIPPESADVLSKVRKLSEHLYGQEIKTRRDEARPDALEASLQRNRLLNDRLHSQRLKKGAQLRQEEAQYAPSAQDIAQAHRAQIELFERLNQEEALRKKQNGGGNNKKNGGGKHGKGKKKK